MYDAVIISGGNIHEDFALNFLKKIMMNSKSRPLFLAADRGMEFFLKTEILPDYVVGDFDSLGEEALYKMEELEKKDCLKVVRLKPEKDDSDTQSALNLAASRGCRNILLLGITGSRLDHVIANIELLYWGYLRGIRITLLDKYNFIRIIESGERLKKSDQFGKYTSFYPMGSQVRGLSLTGFKYGLRSYTLTLRDCGLTVSNEIVQETACVEYEEGLLFMIQSRD